MDIAQELGYRNYRVPEYEPSRDPNHPSNRPHSAPRTSATRNRYLPENRPSTSRDSDLVRQNAALRARLEEMERAIGKSFFFFFSFRG